MKKTYEAPSIEKIEFQYRDQVVVASGCLSQKNNWGPVDSDECTQPGETGNRTN